MVALRIDGPCRRRPASLVWRPALRDAVHRLRPALAAPRARARRGLGVGEATQAARRGPGRLGDDDHRHHRADVSIAPAPLASPDRRTQGHQLQHVVEEHGRDEDRERGPATTPVRPPPAGDPGGGPRSAHRRRWRALPRVPHSRRLRPCAPAGDREPLPHRVEGEPRAEGKCAEGGAPLARRSHHHLQRASAAAWRVAGPVLRDRCAPGGGRAPGERTGDPRRRLQRARLVPAIRNGVERARQRARGAWIRVWLHLSRAHRVALRRSSRHTARAHRPHLLHESLRRRAGRDHRRLWGLRPPSGLRGARDPSRGRSFERHR